MRRTVIRDWAGGCGGGLATVGSVGRLLPARCFCRSSLLPPRSFSSSSSSHSGRGVSRSQLSRPSSLLGRSPRPAVLSSPHASLLLGALLPCSSPPARLLFTSATIFTLYVDLPADYDDAVGLRFRAKDLTRSEIVDVFGPRMNPVLGNRLLRILHGRRVAGTLDDPAFRINTAAFSQAEIDAGLAYLRRTVAVDELLNAGLRAEDELAAMEALESEELDRGVEAEADGGEGGKESEKTDRGGGKESEKTDRGGGKESEKTDAKPPYPGAADAALENLTAQKWRSRLFKDAPVDDVYGVGAFDVIRARNRLKFEEAERQRRAAEEKRQQQREAEAAARRAAGGAEEGGGALTTAGDASGAAAPALLTRPPMSPSMQKWVAAATSPLQAPPSMSKWQRLWPSYVFVLSLVGGGAVLAGGGGVLAGDGGGGPVLGGHGGGEGQEAASERAETGASSDVSSSASASSLSPAARTVLGLVAANVAVWALWRVPPLWPLLNRYLIVVPATPRPLSLVGAMFSHQKAGHLAANMLFLSFIGLRLHDEVGGRGPFLELYLASGSLAFLASLTNIVLRNRLHLTTLGASGAIYGLATAYFTMHKFESFKILGLPPDPYNGVQGLGFIGLMLGLNLLALRAEKQAVDVVTHFAGMAVGAAAGELLRRRQEGSSAEAEAKSGSAETDEGKDRQG